MRNIRLKHALALIGVALGAMIAVAATARAGWSTQVPIYVSSSVSTGIAMGSLRDTRDSTDSVAYIGCYSTLSQYGTTVYCAASDATGVYRTCTASGTAAQDFARIIGSINEHSGLVFQWTNGVCTEIGVENNSALLR